MANWIHELNIKQYLGNGTDDETVKKIAKSIYDDLMKFINILRTKEIHKEFCELNKDEVFQLENVAEEFKFLADTVGQDIHDVYGCCENYEDCPFYEWYEVLNQELDNLYDIGDSWVETKYGGNGKFIWFGL